MEDKHQLNISIIKEPYIGPRPFEERDEAIFFGRDQETNELASIIIAHPLVLLYSQSGAGKTSLLKASLIPLLKRRRLEVFPPARVRGQEASVGKVHEKINIYVHNALTYLKGSNFNQTVQADNSLLTYVPATKTNNKREISSIRVLIFDQFEEIFTLYPERFDDRQDFFEQISMLLKNDPLLRIVLAMREDYIAELDTYAPGLPEKLHTRYRLLRLDEEAARAAIEKPLERANQSQKVKYSFESQATDKIVDSLRAISVKQPSGEKQVLGPYVEPVHLQVVCQTIWRKLEPTFNQKFKEGIYQISITTHDIEEFGDVNNALSEFYENGLYKALKAVSNNTGKKGKLIERNLRAWFGKVLITPEDTRSTVFCGRKEETVAGIPKDAVRELENHRLIRAELRGGEIWYELSHDRLIQPIRNSNEKWLLSEPISQQKGQELEIKADEWERSGKSRKGLLEGTDLTAALRWIEGPEAENIGFSPSLYAFIQASKVAKQRKRFRMLIGGSALLCILLIWAIDSTIKANAATNEAKKAKAVAEKAAIKEKEATASANRLNAKLRQQYSLLLQAAAEQERLRAVAEQAESSAKAQAKMALIAKIYAESQRQRADSAKESAEYNYKQLQEQIALASNRGDTLNRQRDTLKQQQQQEKLNYQASGSVYSRDEKYVVTLSDSLSVKLWDVTSGKLIATLGNESATATAFDPSVKFVAIANFHDAIKIFSVPEGLVKYTLNISNKTIRKISFSLDSRYLGAVTYDGQVLLWNLSGHIEYWELPVETFTRSNPIVDINFSKDNRQLQTTTSDGAIYFWDLYSKKLLKSFQ